MLGHVPGISRSYVPDFTPGLNRYSMDVSILERNARLGAYDIDADLIGNNGRLKIASGKAEVTKEKLRKQLREDCILAAISAGCTRRGSKLIFQMVYESMATKSHLEVAITMIQMIRKAT